LPTSFSTAPVVEVKLVGAGWRGAGQAACPWQLPAAQQVEPSWVDRHASAPAIAISVKIMTSEVVGVLAAVQLWMFQGRVGLLPKTSTCFRVPLRHGDVRAGRNALEVLGPGHGKGRARGCELGGTAAQL
jgi:hypothetical protein